MTHYRSMRGFTEHNIDMHFLRYFVFSMQGDDGYSNPKMQDKRVREAIYYAIDNVGLVETIYFQIANQISTSIKDAEGFYDYNPEMARELLLEANYDFNEPIRLMYYYKDNTSNEVMKFIAKNLEAVGLKVELLQPDTIINTSLYKNRNYDILFKGLAAFNDIDWFQEYAQSHPTLTNIIDTKGEFEDLLDELVRSAKPATHAEVLQKLHALDREKLYKFPIYSPLQIAYINSDRLVLPKKTVFANPWYISNLDFANWEILKK